MKPDRARDGTSVGLAAAHRCPNDHRSPLRRRARTWRGQYLRADRASSVPIRSACPLTHDGPQSLSTSHAKAAKPGEPDRRRLPGHTHITTPSPGGPGLSQKPASIWATSPSRRPAQAASTDVPIWRGRREVLTYAGSRARVMGVSLIGVGGKRVWTAGRSEFDLGVQRSGFEQVGDPGACGGGDCVRRLELQSDGFPRLGPDVITPGEVARRSVAIMSAISCISSAPMPSVVIARRAEPQAAGVPGAVGVVGNDVAVERDVGCRAAPLRPGGR